MDNAMWREIVEEARDRLSNGIAKDVDDAVDQLIDEGLVRDIYGEHLKKQLEYPR